MNEQTESIEESNRAAFNITKLAVPNTHGYDFIMTKDIIRCEADSSYTNFFLVNGKKMVAARSLIEYEKILSAYNFFRIHQSHLINLDHISKYLREGGGYVVMDDESIVEISRRKRVDFLQKLKSRYMLPNV